jgi:uncharacterized protein
MEILGYILLFLVGLILGTLGGGGAILSVPILVYLFTLDIVVASGYSLFIVGVTSMVGSIVKYKSKMVSISSSFIFGLPSLIFVFITRKWIVSSIPEIIFQFGNFQFTKRFMLLGLFAVLMVLAAIASIKRISSTIEGGKNNSSITYLVLLGSITGLCCGLVGAGGGFIIIPVLIYYTDLDFKTAVGTALIIITFNSLIGFMGDVINYTVNWQFLLLITGLSVLGMLASGKSTQKLSLVQLQKAFAWFVLALGVLILISEVFSIYQMELNVLYSHPMR